MTHALSKGEQPIIPSFWSLIAAFVVAKVI